MTRSWGDAIRLIGALALLVLLGAAVKGPASRAGLAHPASALTVSPWPTPLEVTAAPGSKVRYTLDGSVPGPMSPVWNGADALDLAPAQRAAERAIRTSTSPQWRAPVLASYPMAPAIRLCAFDPTGAAGAVVTRSLVVPDHRLPTLALVMEPGALFDPDSGIYVPGHAVFHTEEEPVRRFPGDQRWWKYPGNYHFRGRAWERTAWMEWNDPAAPEAFNGPVQVRINGNNTRGFPQHALRLILGTDRAGSPMERMGEGPHHTMVLRAGGNDQDRTMLRDAIAHTLCEDLGFMTSRSRSCVVYINGAYWGLHQLRERMDEREVAARCGVSRKEITLLADRGVLEHGSESELHAFMAGVAAIEALVDQGKDPGPALEDLIDVEGFLTYIAAQVIIGNSDWPDQNVKYWRYAGRKPGAEAWRDGRWRFIMGDSDLSLGYPMPASFPMLDHLMTHHSPVARLFKGCMASPGVRSRFIQRTEALLARELSAARITTVVRAMAVEVDPEVPMHVARWRRPLTVSGWEKQVDLLLAFATERPAHVKAQLELFASRTM